MAGRKRRKTTAKTTAIPKVPQPHGGALNAGGTPGNKGGGRPPKAFKDFLSDLRSDPRVHEQLELAATSASHPAFKTALDVLVKYDDEKPAEKREIVPTLQPEERESRVLELLKGAKQRKVGK